jgi:hypothetical protein
VARRWPARCAIGLTEFCVPEEHGPHLFERRAHLAARLGRDPRRALRELAALEGWLGRAADQRGMLRAVKRVRSVASLCLALVALGVACSPEAPAQKKDAPASGGVTADEIPTARTPPGGYGLRFPSPVLADCTEPLVAGAPDLRGIWRTVRAERDGEPVPAGAYIYSYVERIEQCGDRIVDMGGGTIADARADGSFENGVHDVSVFDYTTPVHAVASYEDGVFVLRPVLFPALPFTIPRLKVTRRLDAEGHMVWTRPDQGHLVVTLERIGGPTDGYTKIDPRRPDGGPSPGTPLWLYRLRTLWAFLTA